MKRFISNRFVIFTLGIIFVVLLWVIISLLFDKNGNIFPSPIMTFERFSEIIKDPYTFKCVGYTMLRMLIGFSASLVLALLIGVFAGNHPTIYQFLKPLLITLRSIPTVALIFVFIVMVDPKDAPILIVLVICFPILYEGITGGMRNVDRLYLDSARVDGAHYFKRMATIKIPLAIPYIVVAMVSSFALSFKIEIMAEAMSGYTKNGIGSVIRAALSDVDDPHPMITIFAYSLFAILLMLIVSLIQEIITGMMKKKGIIIVNNN